MEINFTQFYRFNSRNVYKNKRKSMRTKNATHTTSDEKQQKTDNSAIYLQEIMQNIESERKKRKMNVCMHMYLVTEQRQFCEQLKKELNTPAYSVSRRKHPKINKAAKHAKMWAKMWAKKVIVDAVVVSVCVEFCLHITKN